MRLGEDRPFLREDESTVAIVRAGATRRGVDDIQDVLHDAGLLIVGFLDEEGVVHDPGRGSRGRFFERGNRIRGAESDDAGQSAEQKMKASDGNMRMPTIADILPRFESRLRTFSAVTLSNL